mmetsp:Transcript_24829/g.77260  ORF Transcript_24829/g.77260 Transcript_24829/m.77260 type:complete len:98 (-) Transcript_24829:209-502(-)
MTSFGGLPHVLDFGHELLQDGFPVCGAHGCCTCDGDTVLRLAVEVDASAIPDNVLCLCDWVHAFWQAGWWYRVRCASVCSLRCSVRPKSGLPSCVQV